eukprot:gene648-365_t
MIVPWKALLLLADGAEKTNKTNKKKNYRHCVAPRTRLVFYSVIEAQSWMEVPVVNDNNNKDLKEGNNNLVFFLFPAVKEMERVEFLWIFSPFRPTDEDIPLIYFVDYKLSHSLFNKIAKAGVDLVIGPLCGGAP